MVVVLDEIQRRPELFQALRVLADRRPLRARFLVLGSASPALGINVAAGAMRRFWTMLAHHHGQLWNASEFGRSFGLADTTVRGYLDKLADAFAVRQLQPWHENIGKRQVRAPKVYVRDSGILHALLDIRGQADLETHPKVGASWEGFMLEQIIQQLDARPGECYFWRTHTGAELDLLIVRGRRRIGFEIKRSTAPAVTPSMRSALADLKLDRLVVIYPGALEYPLAPRALACPAARLAEPRGLERLLR